MRKVVAYEGRETKDGRTLMPNSLLVVEEEIPVTIYGDGGVGNKIGVARDMRREEFGSISFEVNVEDEDRLTDYTPLIYISDVSNTIEDGHQYFQEATIREICYVYQGVNAWGES